MGWEYSDKTKQLFMDAVQGKPGTHLGEIENADGVGEHGSIACGDALKFSFRVKKDDSDPTKDVIVEARYLTFGCTSAIAASEALCCLIEDRPITPIQALKITNADIVNFLEGLPQQKIHCSVMGAEALQAAVFDWARKRNVSIRELGIDTLPAEENEGRIVCKCFGISEPYIKRKIKELNLRTIPEITDAIKAGGSCMNCHHEPGGLQDILNEVWGNNSSKDSSSIDSSSQDSSVKDSAFGTTNPVSATPVLNDGTIQTNGTANRTTAEKTAGTTSGTHLYSLDSLPMSRDFVPSNAPVFNSSASIHSGSNDSDSNGSDSNGSSSKEKTSKEDSENFNRSSGAVGDFASLSPYQRSKKIDQLFDTYIRPIIRRDGGDIEVVDIKDKVVYIQLQGACADCNSSTATVKNIIEKSLQSQIDPEIRVIEI